MCTSGDTSNYVLSLFGVNINNCNYDTAVIEYHRQLWLEASNILIHWREKAQGDILSWLWWGGNRWSLLDSSHKGVEIRNFDV